MKLIRCHVDNFGKLNNFDYDFTDGVNTVYEGNGYGKSTLVAFIRVMFYGFENETKREKLVNERKKYAPWQGGVYGGTLVFEARGEKYQLMRTFGSKSSEDEFSLFKSDTMVQSSDYDENIGEEIFAIDSESFMRSIMISQNDCISHTTDGINAKIGNITDVTDDINNFDSAMSIIKDEINALRPNHSKGLINKLKTDLVSDGEIIKKAPGIDEAIKNNKQKQDEYKAERDQKIKKVAELRNIRDLVGKNREIAAQKEHYEGLCRNYEVKKERLSLIGTFFKGDIPESAEIGENTENAKKAVLLRQTINANKPSPEEKMEYESLETMFSGQEFDVDKLNRMEAKTRELENLNDKLNNEKNSFGDDFDFEYLNSRFKTAALDEPTLDLYVSEWNRRTEIKNNLAIKKDNAEKKAKEDASKRKAVLLTIGISMIAIGLCEIYMAVGILGKTGLLSIGVVLFIIGALTACVNQIRDKKNPQKSPELIALLEDIGKDEEYIAEVENHTENFLTNMNCRYDEYNAINTLNDLRNDFKQYSRILDKRAKMATSDTLKQYEEIKATLNNYFAPYASRLNMEARPIEKIYELRRHYERHMELDKKVGVYSNAVEKYDSYFVEIKAFLEEYGFNADDNFLDLILKIGKEEAEYRNAFNEYEAAAREKESFEEKENIEAIKAYIPEENESMAVYDNGDIEFLTNEIEELNRKIREYESRINDDMEKRDSIREVENGYEEKKLRIEELSNQFKLLELTRDMLEEAKCSFTSKYVVPVKDAFTRYYAMLTGNTSANISINANAELLITEQGQIRDPLSFSTGIKDLTGIAFRMALVDAMYREEKPFVIFDDPFVNLDDEKTELGMRFVSELAKEHQVLYFTCHSVRAGRK